jgi:hypothetical protein
VDVDQHTLQKLADCGAIIPLAQGKLGVKVMLEYRQAVPANSFRETKRFLQTKFDELVQVMPALNIDLNGISVTALTVNGTLPLDQLDELRKLVRDRQMRLQVSRADADTATDQS